MPVLYRPHLHTEGLWGFFTALWITAEIGLLFDLFDVSRERTLQLSEVGLATFGAIFAILAMVDAHKAFIKAEQVEEAIGSFRMSFEEVLGEMLNICSNAKQQLSILIPTPGYGYLFGQQESSRAFAKALKTFLEKPGTTLELYLVVGDTSRPRSTLLSQRYLQRAFSLDANRNVRPMIADEYMMLVRQVFDAIKKNPGKATLTLLKSDPNVRLILADAQDDGARCCLLSFAQSNPENIKGEFKSTGFKSAHRHMVQAVQDLINVCKDEQRTDVEMEAIDDIGSLYTIAQ